MNHRESDFEVLTFPLLDSLYRTSLRMVHDRSAAEQCVERTYLEASRCFARDPEIRTLRVGLFTILFRTIRSRTGRWFQLRDWLALSNGPNGRATKSTAEVELDPTLEAVDNIPAHLREVVLLADVEEFTGTEIQTILGLGPDLIAARLAEGRAKLFADLEPRKDPNLGLLDGPATA